MGRGLSQRHSSTSSSERDAAAISLPSSSSAPGFSDGDDSTPIRDAEDLTPPHASDSCATSVRKSVSDFGNIFKAFIGANYLGMPFAFSQSGWLLGLIGLVVIATITVHCCSLIIRCKRKAVERVLQSLPRAALLSVSDRDALRERLDQQLQYGDVGQVAFGAVGLWIVNVALVFTQFGFCVIYMIFMSNTLGNLLPASWPPAALTLLPLPVVMACALVRNVRALAPVSILADITTLLGFVAVLVYMLRGFSVAASANAVNWRTAAVFFGTVTASFEGIGTVIPIEASMSGMRHRYEPFLLAALTIVSAILGSFGAVGYLRYGEQTPQMITQILPPGEPLSECLDVLMVLGVLFTFPLQLFPVIQVVEQIVFFGGFQAVDAASLITEPSIESAAAVAAAAASATVPNGAGINSLSSDRAVVDLGFGVESTPGTNAVAASSSGTGGSLLAWECERSLWSWLVWKQNLLRVLLALSTAVVAIVFRDYFSYWSSLVGAIGGAVLSYIMPPMIDLWLNHESQNIWSRTKNVAIVALGVVGGVIGVTVTIWQMIYPPAGDMAMTSMTS